LTPARGAQVELSIVPHCNESSGVTSRGQRMSFGEEMKYLLPSAFGGISYPVSMISGFSIET
jgi:hypothetical protein